MNRKIRMGRTAKLLADAAFAVAPLAALTPATAQAQAIEVGASYGAPPAIPEYDQPPAPGDGYIWTPGYWAWDASANDYYWIDGAWVMPPYTGALWTPGWWGPGYGGGFLWNAGYWGPTIGYYGGVNYGFGYFGVGYYGGYWNGGHFWYNRPYNHFGVGFHGNFYNTPRAGFNGRAGGLAYTAHPGGFHGYSGING